MWNAGPTFKAAEFGCVILADMPGPRVSPGATQLTRMFLGAYVADALSARPAVKIHASQSDFWPRPFFPRASPGATQLTRMFLGAYVADALSVSPADKILQSRCVHH